MWDYNRKLNLSFFFLYFLQSNVVSSQQILRVLKKSSSLSGNSFHLDDVKIKKETDHWQPHNFKFKTFNSPVFCQLCDGLNILKRSKTNYYWWKRIFVGSQKTGEFISKRIFEIQFCQGLICKICNFIVHERCMNEVPPNCHNNGQNNVEQISSPRTTSPLQDHSNSLTNIWDEG